MTMDQQTPSYVHVNPDFLAMDAGGGRDGYSAAAAYNHHYSGYRADHGHGRDRDHHHHHHHDRHHGGHEGRGGSGPGDALANMKMQMSDARRMRKTIFRRTIDYNTPVMTYLEDRIYRRTPYDRRWIQSDYLYQGLMVPPFDMLDMPMNCVTTKHVRTSTNKNKCPIFALCWTPEGRRLITGSSSGEFTLWNGLTFNFETILQAHDSPIRCMLWSHNEDWLLTADNAGFVKYWQANMNNVKVYQAHKDPVRGVSFCCSDSKFVTCSDDSTVRVWDFVRCQEERVLRGHGADVRCVAWHPWRSLIISGSKDAQQPIKLWDPKSGQSLATLYVHKNTCTDVAWNANGNWFLTASRDHQIKLFDVRNMRREVQIYRGHRKDVMRVAWHPHHESLFASGGADGAIMYWMVGAEMEVGAVEDAHEHMIWSLAWHPLGHILVSGSNDFTTKFWTRNRPGDVLKESAVRSIANTSFLSNPSGPAATTPNKEEKAPRPKVVAASSEKAVTNTAAAIADDESVLIPGLFEGVVSDQNVTSDDLDERARKARLQKSIPRAFAANWASARSAAMPALLPNPVQPIEPTISAAVSQTPSERSSAITGAAAGSAPPRPPPSATPMDFDNMSLLDESDFDTQSVISEPPMVMGPQQQQRMGGGPQGAFRPQGPRFMRPMGPMQGQQGGPMGGMGGMGGMRGPGGQMGGPGGQMDGHGGQMGGPGVQMGGPGGQMGGPGRQMGGPGGQMGGPGGGMGNMGGGPMANGPQMGPQRGSMGPGGQMGGPMGPRGGPMGGGGTMGPMARGGGQMGPRGPMGGPGGPMGGPRGGGGGPMGSRGGPMGPMAGGRGGPMGRGGGQMGGPMAGAGHMGPMGGGNNGPMTQMGGGGGGPMAQMGGGAMGPQRPGQFQRLGFGPGPRGPMRGPQPQQGGPGGMGQPQQRFQRPQWGGQGPQMPAPGQDQQQHPHQQQQQSGGPWGMGSRGPVPPQQQRPPQSMHDDSGYGNSHSEYDLGEFDFEYEEYDGYEAAEDEYYPEEDDGSYGGPPMGMEGGGMKRGHSGAGPQPPMPKQQRGGGGGGPFRGRRGRGGRGGRAR